LRDPNRPLSASRARSAACCAALLVVALGAGPAAAQLRSPGNSGGLPTNLPATPVGGDSLVRPRRDDVPPRGRALTAQRVAAVADRLAQVRRERREHPGATREVFLKGIDLWQVSYFAKTRPGEPRQEIAQVLIDDPTARVVEAWTDYQVPWSMARGYPGAFGRIVNAPWVWIPLVVLFVAPFLRPPWRMLHLDLLVLSAFSASTAFFNAARIDWSVPLVYPLLGYLLGRMLWIGLRRGEAAREQAQSPLRLLVPVSWLAIAVIFLVGFRVALNVTNSNVIDVGYAGVIGADRIVDGDPLYGRFPSDNAMGDTYGPVIYLAYVPFEQALKWSGRWDDLPAAHAAAITFDLLALALCFLIGRRMRGPDLGVLLAYAWATYPFTLYALMSNSNDGLVAALVLAAVWAAGSAPARGALVALAGLTKFAPLALAPLFALHGRPRSRPRALVAYGLGFAAAGGLAFAPLAADLDLRDFWDHTIAFQAARGSPFSIWGLYDPDVPWLNHAQRAVQIAGGLLALALAFVPRRRDLLGLAACAAAILIALQIGVTHWFYLYVPWFFGLVMIALLGRFALPAERTGA
jgi:Glycosyltransferase family 87